MVPRVPALVPYRRETRTPHDEARLLSLTGKTRWTPIAPSFPDHGAIHAGLLGERRHLPQVVQMRDAGVSTALTSSCSTMVRLSPTARPTRYRRLAIKDVVGQTMKRHRVERRFGWDTHARRRARGAASSGIEDVTDHP